jgi:hypothetical protein
VEEDNVREFVQEYTNKGQNTMVLVAALKFRFNYCEKRDFSFKKLIQKSEHEHPHSALTP